MLWLQLQQLSRWPSYPRIFSNKRVNTTEFVDTLEHIHMYQTHPFHSVSLAMIAQADNIPTMSELLSMETLIKLWCIVDSVCSTKWFLPPVFVQF